MLPLLEILLLEPRQAMAVPKIVYDHIERIVFVLGFVDTTDYVDLYTLANPWTDFLNFDFASDSG